MKKQYVAVTRKYALISGLWDRKELTRREIDAEKDYYEVDLKAGTIVKINPKLVIEN